MVNYSQTELDNIFHALSDSTRRAILQQVSSRQCTVSELAAPHKMSMAAISKHLKVLEKAKLITRRKQGRQYFCQLQPESLKTAEDWLAFYQEFWTANLDALEEMFRQEQSLNSDVPDDTDQENNGG